MNDAHFEVWKSKQDQLWRYRFVGGNGEKMVVSEAYPTKDHAIRGVRDLRVAIHLAAGNDVRELG